MHFLQCIVQIVQQVPEVARCGDFRPADQYVIPACAAFKGQDGAGNFAQAALGAVAGHRVSDLFGAGETDADGGAVVVAVARLQHETFGSLLARPRRGQEIGALGDGLQTNGNRRWRVTGALMGALWCLRRFHNIKALSGRPYADRLARP